MKARGKNVLATVLTIVVGGAFFCLNKAPMSSSPRGMIGLVVGALVLWCIARLIIAILIRNK